MSALFACVLTWDSDGKFFRLNGQEPPTQLIVPAVGGADESDGPLPTGGLVIERHLLIRQDIVVVWRDTVGEPSVASAAVNASGTNSCTCVLNF